WRSGVDSRTDDLRALQEEATTGAVNAVSDLAASSRRLLLLAAAAAILTVFITVMLLRRAIGSIAKPLAALAVQAEEVARVRLPEAVKAQQDDPDSRRELPALHAEGAAEVHEVASAFNDVQNTALRLASEQAALRVNQAEALTNLGRRNQTLLVRQLDFISSLETEETDPEFLEHLFKLDHLASRMRRNAESLLILAGSETPRRRRKPAEVSEVIRAAMSEVEDFERVRIGHLRDSTLVGPVVIDLIHLLAELVENALGFSPPNTTVEIDGGPLGQGGYQFAVIDHGVGMSDVELMAANHRLAGLDEFDGMPTRYLGQYVVAKLAAKIGVIVRLQPTTGGRGVSAIITLPAAAMFGAPDRGAAARPRPGTRAAREQGPVPFAPGTAVPHVDGGVPEIHQVPDLRDAHLSDAPNQFQVEDPAVDTPTADPQIAEAPATDVDPADAPTADAPAQPSSAHAADLQPERWDRVVESVLDSVLDLSDLEAISLAATPSIGSSPAEPTTSVADATLQSESPARPENELGLYATSDATSNVPSDGPSDDPSGGPSDEPSGLVVSSDEVAEMFGGEISDEPARWWIAPTLTPDPAPPTRATASASADASAEQNRTTPPVFRAGTDTPVQDWRIEPAIDATPASTTPTSMPSGEAPPVEPVPTKPPPAERPPSPPSAEQPPVSAGTAGPSNTGEATGVPAAPVPSAVDPSPAPVPSTAGDFGAAVPSAVGGTGSGLLRKRVPGASLAARTPDAIAAPAKSVERSADEVRARLASFQAGRSRGRTIPDAGEVPAAVLDSDVPKASPLGELDDSGMSQDWRSSK
ncbi:MAG: ATP-binding protein, partial [Microthrixaceae bacterium]